MAEMIPRGIVIHHSATPDQDVLDFPALLRYHTEVNGWSDIGYHAVVEQVDRGIACLYGRPPYRYGAHAAGANNYLGLCFVGDYDRLPPPGIVIDAAIHRIVVPWCRMFDLDSTNVLGHRELPGVDKTCPGLRFDMHDFRRRVAEELGDEPV